jgi:hypothetical protein
VYRVEKSKDCNRSGEALSTSDLERLSLFITSTPPVESLKIQLLTQGTSAFLKFRHPKVINCRKHSFEDRTQPLRNLSTRSRAGCTNESSFNWVFMKLPDSTKKQETRATLNTIKIMSLIKREMKFRDIRLGKIGDHICTNRRIKLRENRRNIELFTNKHKIVATFIHVGNDQGPLETL